MNTIQTMNEAERKLILAYRAADARGKRAIMEYAESMAEDWPAPRRAELSVIVLAMEGKLVNAGS